MEHSRLPCLHPLSTSTVYIPVYIHWGASSWPTAPIARILDASIHSPKTDLHLSFYSMEKIILKKQPWYKTDKNNSSLKMSNLDTIQCGCNSRHSNEHLGGLTYEEVASLRSWQAALVDSGTLGLFLESRGREPAISILNPWGTASRVLITPRAT